VLAALWFLVAGIGIEAVAMAWRVFRDDDWEVGDWWALENWIALRGLLFTFLFPITRTPHTRTAERANAVIVAGFGVIWAVIGLLLLTHELH
jgi:hypothetical protein